MLTENQEKWLQALESGKYKQGYGLLKRRENEDITYCCLGVACEVLGIPSELVHGACYFIFDGNDSFLPDSVTKMLNLFSNNGGVSDNEAFIDSFESLTRLNDSKTYSFKQIATFIRANPEKIFKTEE